MKHIEVVAAIIIYDKKILCMQRAQGKHDYVSCKYEFPGGKIEAGETHVNALMRELKEEMSMEVIIEEEDHFLTVHHEYPDFSITLYSYLCRVDTKSFVRKEHINHVWLPAVCLHELDWAQADIPIVNKLQGENILE